MKKCKFLNLTVLIENSQGYSGQNFQFLPAILPVELLYKKTNSVNQVLSISPLAGLPKWLRDPGFSKRSANNFYQ